MINVKEIFRVGLILFIIAALSSLLLAYANQVTAPLIEENTRKKTEASMSVVMPDADTFEQVENTSDDIVEAYVAKAGGETVGVCIVCEENGYNGAVRIVAGVDDEGKVTGVDILSHSETPGLGANAEKDSFKDQFKGKTADIGVVKSNAGANEINAISGATITSRAVTGAVNKAISAAADILEEVQ